MKGFLNEYMKFKRPRLVEEYIPYETLVMDQIGSEDEYPMKYSRENNQHRRQ